LAARERFTSWELTPSALRLLNDRQDSDPAPTLGQVVVEGRPSLHRNDLPDWDVYQLYGDPLFRFWPEALGRTTAH